jgi:predicted acylesterase/phospholipase RssA
MSRRIASCSHRRNVRFVRHSKVPPHPATGDLDDVNFFQYENELTDVTIGVSLSGGGYRATLFAMGAFLALYDAELWTKIRWIASVSGGSFASGAIATHLPHDPTPAEFDALVNHTVKTVGRPVSLAGRPRGTTGAGRVGTAYEAGIDRSWLGNKQRRLRDIQRDDRIHAFLAVDLPSLKPVFVTDWIVHTIGLDNENHVACKPGPLSLASAVRASASFPGLPSVRISHDDLGDPVRDPVDHDLLLADGGAWNNLGTNWERELGWLDRERVELPAALAAAQEVGLHVVVDAGVPVTRPTARWIERGGCLALDRPLVSIVRTFRALLQSSMEAHHLALRDSDYTLPRRVALVSLDTIPQEIDPRPPIAGDASKSDWLAVSEHNCSITLGQTVFGVCRESAIHLLAHGYAVTAAQLAVRGVPYERFAVPHERIDRALNSRRSAGRNELTGTVFEWRPM